MVLKGVLSFFVEVLGEGWSTFSFLAGETLKNESIGDSLVLEVVLGLFCCLDFDVWRG